MDSHSYANIYHWITQWLNPKDDIDYIALQEEITAETGVLPRILRDGTTHIRTDMEFLIQDTAGEISSSPKLMYVLLSKGRWLCSLAAYAFLLAGLLCLILFQIEIRKETQEHFFLYSACTIIFFAASFLLRKSSRKLLSLIIGSLQPEDFLRILAEPDEMIEQEVKVNGMSRNETMFNKTSTFISKKRYLCEQFLEKSESLPDTNVRNLITVLVTDHLINSCAQGAYKTYLLEKKTEAAQAVCKSFPHSAAAGYQLAVCYLEQESFEDAYGTFLQYRNMNGCDWMIEAHIQTYEFCRNHLMQ